MIECTRDLQSIKYRKLLSAFFDTYEKVKEFHGFEHEAKMIKDFELKLLEECLGLTLAEHIERPMRASLAVSFIDEKYRDHFIHSFQDFLTGLLVIDRFYEDFSTWYSTSLNNEINSSIECAWLLTTLFHDHERDFPTITKFVDEEPKLPRRLRDRAKCTQYAKDLSSVYDHLNAGKPLDTWASSNGTSPPSALATLLLDQLDNLNHGVVGAFSLLSYDLQETIHPSLVYSSALAIAFHDRGPREDLLAQHVFPISMRRFPLAALLLYCDAVQEWDRSRLVSEQLVDIKLGQASSKHVIFVIHFGSAHSNKLKAEEFESVDRCICDNPIKLGFESSIIIGQNQ